MSFFACQHDLQEPTIKNWPISTVSKVESAKIWFENYQKSDAIDPASKFKNMQPQWNDALVNGNAVEVIFTINGNIAVPSLYNNFTHLGRQRLVIYDKGNEGRVAYVYSYMPSKECPIRMKDVNAITFSLKGFDGMIAVYSLNDENLGGYVWKQGEFTKKLIAKQKNILAEEICLTVTEEYGCGRVCIGPECGDIQCSTRNITQCWDETAGGGGGGAGNGGGGNGSGGNGGGCQGPFCNGNDDGGGGNGGGIGNDGGGRSGGGVGDSAGGGIFNPCLLYPSLCGLGGNNGSGRSAVQMWLDNNDTSKLILNPCTKYVYNKLISTPGNFMYNTLKNFYGQSPVIHLKWEISATTHNDAYGQCLYIPGQFSATITMNSTFLSEANPTMVASVMIHEAMHAELARKVQSIGGAANLSTANFPTLFNYYSNYADPDHNFLAENYVSKFMTALKQFDGACGFPLRPDSDYLAMIWGGLQLTDAFSRLDANKQVTYHDRATVLAGSGGCPQ